MWTFRFGAGSVLSITSMGLGGFTRLRNFDGRRFSSIVFALAGLAFPAAVDDFPVAADSRPASFAARPSIIVRAAVARARDVGFVGLAMAQNLCLRR
jgi:hypothetical protein